ncbi:hypothetical protein GCM10027063_27490 [Promicromonospora xylanilytica]
MPRPGQRVARSVLVGSALARSVLALEHERSVTPLPPGAPAWTSLRDCRARGSGPESRRVGPSHWVRSLVELVVSDFGPLT